MKKRLKENSLLGAFQLEGTPTEQENLNKLVKEVLNTKSGRQLVEDVLASNFVPKPIQLKFVPQEKIEGWGGMSYPDKGIIELLPINPDKPLDNLMKISTLVHELYHLKNGEIFTPMLEKSSFAQRIYNRLTDEACAYAFEACVFGKELMAIHPEYKLTCGFSQKEFIEGWMYGKIKTLAQTYVNNYAEKRMLWAPPMKEREFMTQMAKFQQRETALPMESFPWYKPSKSGGYYIVGTKAMVEMDKRGAPVFRCVYLGDKKFKSIVYSREQKKVEDGGFVPVNSIKGIAERPALPIECIQAQDFMDGKISKEDLSDIENMSLPKGVNNMQAIVAWRESFVPEKPIPTASRKKVLRKTNIHE